MTPITAFRRTPQFTCHLPSGDSHLDLLVIWEPGRSLLDHAGLVQDLQELLGVKVHAETEKSLHLCVRDKIFREGTPL
ncbi:MAG TPA: hypothetical protein VKV15_06205 [Bryobacteraceae bacterium]|nr:hypothetical protein [Bryobacteraceae bacterium]